MERAEAMPALQTDIRLSPFLCMLGCAVHFEWQPVTRHILKYQIESSHPMVGPLLPEGGVAHLQINDHALAIVIAAKSVTIPYGREIRVVHLKTGEVIFRKTAATDTHLGED
jgi:hypothetical protein